MIVGDLDIICAALLPAETYPPLIVDPNAVLCGAITLELFEMISWQSQVSPKV